MSKFFKKRKRFNWKKGVQIHSFARHCFPNSVLLSTYQTSRAAAGANKEGAKNILSFKKKLKSTIKQKIYGCTGDHSTLQNQSNFNIPKFNRWLEKTLRKEQKLF